jgi:pyruvate dehydrogenase E2 component (dihydrolipoamide acetyltransferase)
MTTLTITLNEAQTEWAGAIIATDPDTDVPAALTVLATESLVAALSALSITRATVASNEAENERRKESEAARLEAFPEPEPAPEPEPEPEPEAEPAT